MISWDEQDKGGQRPPGREGSIQMSWVTEAHSIRTPLMIEFVWRMPKAYEETVKRRAERERALLTFREL